MNKAYTIHFDPALPSEKKSTLFKHGIHNFWWLPNFWTFLCAFVSTVVIFNYRIMTTLRPFTCNDLLKYNKVNMDPLTETYGISFYMQYLAHWPEYFQVVEAPNGEIMGYIMGKCEGHGENWHGHVTALTVSNMYRRLGVAATLMSSLEKISETKRCYFVDLFVRVSNLVAINMYQALGYIIYRTVLEYYSGDPDEDAYDMRKALSRDKDKKSIIPLDHPVRPEEVD